MGNRKNIFEFIGDELKDSELKKFGENLKLGHIISNAAPKRTSKPLTNLSTKNTLSAILDICNNSKKIKNPKSKKQTKTKKRI